MANLVNSKYCDKSWKMTETLAHGYSSKSTQQKLSNEYQHDKVLKTFKMFCLFVPLMKVASASKGLNT